MTQSNQTEKPKTMREEKACLTCKGIKHSNPTPDGDEICPRCGGDCVDFEEDTLEDKIYSILFKHSSVDGVRIAYEDEWPLEELADLFQSQLQSVFEEIEMKKIREGLENNDLIGEEVKIYNQAIEDVLSLRQKYLGSKEESK